MKKILVTARKQTRALCLVLTAVLVLAASPAAVSGAGQDAVLFDLCSLGIVDQPREGAEDQITRGEFSTMVVRLMRMEGAASVQLAEEAFSDVPDSHPHQGAIDLLYALNLVNGAQDGGSVAFEPDVPITLLQASKILVNALGYYSQAEEAGGYPGGYQTTANRLHLYNGCLLYTSDAADD